MSKTQHGKIFYYLVAGKEVLQSGRRHSPKLKKLTNRRKLKLDTSIYQKVPLREPSPMTQRGLCNQQKTTKDSHSIPWLLGIT